MVNVVPFRAYRYNSERTGDLGRVVAPPYDVMKGSKVDFYYGLSPYNIAWITKNKPKATDSAENNQYTRARDLLNKWISEGVLTRDEKPAFYIYGQNFNVHGKDHFRFGFIGLIELEEFAISAPTGNEPFTGVLQHEETLPKDIEDRLNLSRNTLAQFGQIFVIYPDHEGKVDSVLEKAMASDTLMDVIDDQGIRHRLWAVVDERDIETISRVMKDRYVIIADGHHRYKTALALKKERPDLKSARYRMMTFVNMANPGLVILPTHRLVQNLETFDREGLLNGISDLFVVNEYDGGLGKEEMFGAMDKAFIEGKHAFGLYMNDEKFYYIELKNEKVLDEYLTGKSEALRKLDVTILHTLILDRVLGIDKEKLAQGTVKGGGFVTYIKGIGDAVDEAIKAVKSGAQAVFFMNPTRIEEVEAVATNFECMPQKSTFFHPKVWTGFTINKIE